MWGGRGAVRAGERENTHHCRPKGRNRHPAPHQALPLPVHGEPLNKDAHADFADGVGGLAPEEAAVDGRADYHYAAATVALEVRQRRLDCPVQALWVDALHQLEPFHGGVAHRSPPDGA